MAKIIEKIKGAFVETQDDNNLETQMGLYFDIIQEHSINLTSQITDNWMEDNSYINDHITNEPLIVNLRGISGEVVYIPSTNEGLLSNIQDDINNKYGRLQMPLNKLGALVQLYPPVDNITQIAKNTVEYVEASYKRYKSIVRRFIDNGQKISRLKQIFSDLDNIRERKLALTVKTPYANFDNMYIQSVVLRQNNENYMTDIELTLKKANFVNSLTTVADQENREKVNFIQRQEVENHGFVQGKEAAENIKSGNGFGIFKASISYNVQE